jgi:hypothetical protein
MKSLKPILLFTGVALGLLAGSASFASPPKGWLLAGSKPAEYDSGLDKSVRHSGAASAFLASRVTSSSGFGTVMQMFKADAYRGKRLKMTAFVKSENVSGWAGLWLRLDAAGGMTMTLDNMQNRAVKGTTDWKRYDIVVDVPAEAAAIYFGALLDGLGKIWFDDFRFDVVRRDVPTTAGPMGSASLPAAPANLGFEE